MEKFDTKRFDAQLAAHKETEPALDASYLKASSIRRSGFIAQEVEEAANKAGYNFSAIIVPDKDQKHYSLSYDLFVVPLVKAVQEQQQLIDKQQKLILEQDKKMAEMQRQLDVIQLLLKNSK